MANFFDLPQDNRLIVQFSASFFSRLTTLLQCFETSSETGMMSERKNPLYKIPF